MASDRDENCNKAKELILSMKGKVPSALNVAAHIDLLHSERSFDIMLDVIVKDWKALELYQNDPYHCGTVKAFLGKVSSESASMDFEY